MKYERKTKKEFGDVYSFNGKIYYDDTADIVQALGKLEDMIDEKVLTFLDDAQDVTVKTIFKYTEEIKALKAENEDLKYHLKKLWEITDKYISNMDKCFKGDKGE